MENGFLIPPVPPVPPCGLQASAPGFLCSRCVRPSSCHSVQPLFFLSVFLCGQPSPRLPSSLAIFIPGQRKKPARTGPGGRLGAGLMKSWSSGLSGSAQVSSA